MRQYIDSGIEWIGKIPETWKVLPHKRIMRKLKEVCFKYDGEDIISLTTNGVLIRDLNAGGKMPTTFDGYQYVYPGNLLMCLFDIDVTPRCVGLIKNVGLTSPAYSQFTFLSNDAYSPYYDYLLRYMDDEKCLLHLSKNLRSSLTEEDFGYISTVLPPLYDQKRIADYLDSKCKEIDSLIELQEQMIEKLKVYKQSVITEVVTKGLDPNAKLVPSGIDWIGDIPESWEVCRFKSHIHLINEKSIESSGVKVNLENIESKSGRYIPTDSKYEGDGTSFRKGDVLFGKLRPYLAKVLAPEFDGAAIGDIYVFRPTDRISTCFLKYMLLSDAFISIVDSSTYGTKMPRANWEFISCVPVVVPTQDEQKVIASFLDEKCVEIDRLLDLKRQKIEKLKDYKKSVIYEAVTGKTIIE